MNTYHNDEWKWVGKIPHYVKIRRTRLVYCNLKFLFLEKYEMKNLVKSVFQKYPQKVMLWRVQWFSGEKIDFLVEK